MTTILVGTDNGLHRIDDGEGVALQGRSVGAITLDGTELLFVVDGSEVWRAPAGEDPELVAEVAGPRLNCVLPTASEVLVGTAEAHVRRVVDGTAELDDTFEAAPGRDTWHTPWGGPPDVRTLARDVDGTIYANVHVGGVVRRRNGAWRDTMDINADVHEVAAHPDRQGVVLVAAALGLGVSHDGGDTWRFETDGLHRSYCRAVAISGERVYVSASAGPGGQQSAVYRTDLDGEGVERCEDGLPEWFSTNVNSMCLAADGDVAVIGDANGTVYRSADAGKSWDVAAEGLPTVRCVALA